jgi:hypothetical protein
MKAPFKICAGFIRSLHGFYEVAHGSNPSAPEAKFLTLSLLRASLDARICSINVFIGFV